jgi:Fic family protein
MYLEKRKTKTGTKYYLAHSFREAGKVHKIRVYLGSNINEQILEQRKTKASDLLNQQLNSFKIIRSPLNYKFSKRESDMVKGLKKKTDFKVFHLSPRDWTRFTELFTYNTNAIEGSTITREEVFDILANNKWPYSKPKEDISETYGVARAIDHIKMIKEHLSMSLILNLHRIIFGNSKSFAGKFREKGVEVGIRDQEGNIVHLGAPSSRLKGLLEELIKWYNHNKNKLPPIVLAAVVHNQFEYIHPFEDGNGRVGRLLMNNILLKNKLPPINISLDNRKEYYETLRLFQKAGDIKPTIELILKEYKRLEKELKEHKKQAKNKKKNKKTKANKSRKKKT